MKTDLNIRIDRFTETQNYKLSMLIIENGKPGKIETHICQTLAEVLEKAAKFEAENLEQFENAIDYKHTDWRQLARQNASKAESQKKP
ncbi:hypothetical protein QEO94_01210 [Kingella negevensis]|uniref:hypothetical protein n=1 Tax=Kingella negevensis TaxID=1522312 RepID=UPI002543A5B6|nr:hypothetical protein [Kingella negevensis]WII93498.1 hypothetical protein QEO94_01210 [Kingella negevensis]